MKCPTCNYSESSVVDTREIEGGRRIRRRRECKTCKKRFTTYERVESTSNLKVVKKDGAREPFDETKILASIQAATGKRPIPEDQKDALCNELTEGIRSNFDREVSSVEIGQRVMAALFRLDRIAHIRFASEYLAMESLEQLKDEINRTQDQPREFPNQGDLF